MKNLTDTKSRFKTDGIFHQLVWLLVTALITFLLAVLVFRWEFESEIDLHVHDTYYIIYTPHLLVVLFLGISLVFFLAKEYRNNFSRTFPNIILLVIGISLIFFLSFLVRYFPTEGWTIYPPLSALEEQKPEGDNPLMYIILVLQVIIILALLHVTFHWGRSKNKPAA